MGRVYAIPIGGVAVSVAQDLWEFAAADDIPLALHSIHLGQSSDTDSEQLRINVKRVSGSPTSGSGGSAATPRPVHSGDAAAGFAAEINNTTQLSGGTSVTLHEDTFNVLNGYVFMPTPEMRLCCKGNEYLVISLTVPADALTVSGTAYVEELN